MTEAKRIVGSAAKEIMLSLSYGGLTDEDKEIELDIVYDMIRSAKSKNIRLPVVFIDRLRQNRKELSKVW